jgi:hypothetical protein
MRPTPDRGRDGAATAHACRAPLAIGLADATAAAAHSLGRGGGASCAVAATPSWCASSRAGAQPRCGTAAQEGSAAVARARSRARVRLSVCARAQVRSSEATS